MNTVGMTSNRPYLLRAMYDWISDNGLTPYILVDAAAPGVEVPQSAVKDGRVVLNVAARAVAQLELGMDRVRFMARFSGVSRSVEAPSAGRLRVVGDLTIRAVTREVVLDVEYGGRGKPWSDERAGFSARAAINRKDFGLAWSQALEAGGLLVGDKVDIEIELQAAKIP